MAPKVATRFAARVKHIVLTEANGMFLCSVATIFSTPRMLQRADERPIDLYDLNDQARPFLSEAQLLILTSVIAVDHEKGQMGLGVCRSLASVRSCSRPESVRGHPSGANYLDDDSSRHKHNHGPNRIDHNYCCHNYGLN